MVTLEVYAIGSDVIIDGDIPAVITAFEVRGKVYLITYQCAWWEERTRKSEWLTADEVKPKDTNRKQSISFK